jgi:hypothetical protein
MNYTVAYDCTRVEALPEPDDHCIEGEQTLEAGAEQTCEPYPDSCTTTVLIEDGGSQAEPIHGGPVTELVFDVNSGTQDTQVNVCLVPGSIDYSDPTAAALCAGEPTCGTIDIVPGCSQQGDCNCDGRVNSGDRLCLISKFFNDVPRGTCPCEDCNVDGNLNAGDAVCITLCRFGECPITRPVGR